MLLPYVSDLSRKRLWKPGSKVLEAGRPHQLLTLVRFYRSGGGGGGWRGGEAWTPSLAYKRLFLVGFHAGGKGLQCPWSRETTSFADISSFLSKWRGGGVSSWDAASTPSTAYTRHFRVGCHACVKGLPPPCTVVSHCVWCQPVWNSCLWLSLTSSVTTPGSVKEEAGGTGVSQLLLLTSQ